MSDIINNVNVGRANAKSIKQKKKFLITLKAYKYSRDWICTTNAIYKMIAQANQGLAAIFIQVSRNSAKCDKLKIHSLSRNKH